MKQPTVGVRASLRAVIAAEAIAVVAMAVLISTGVQMSIAAGAATAIGVLVCMVTVSGLALWQWASLVWRWAR